MIMLITRIKKYNNKWFVYYRGFNKRGFMTASTLWKAIKRTYNS